MTTTEIIKQVVNTQTAIMIRNRKEEHAKGDPWNYDIKELFTGNKKGWFIVDMFTAHAMSKIYEALSNESKARFDKIHINKLVTFTWEHIK